MSERFRRNGLREGSAPPYYRMAGHLVERTDVGPDDEILDVGCGAGSVAITAARRGAEVIGVDSAPSALERGRSNADAAAVSVEWCNGDPRDLPVDDDAFDVTLSSVDHAYGTPSEGTIAELLRVTRPGGRVGFASWTPTSLYSFVRSVLATYLAPEGASGFAERPFAWGDSDVVRSRLDGDVRELAFESATVWYPTLSPAHFWREIATASNAVLESLEGVADDERPAVREELIETIRPYFDDRENAVELEYLLTVARR